MSTIRITVKKDDPIRMLSRAVDALSPGNGALAVRDAAQVYQLGIERRAPKRTGRLAGSFEIRQLGAYEYETSSDLVYAVPQERGAFITPKRAKVLRFHTGVFARRARIPAQPYVAPTFQSDSDQAFEAFCERIERRM